MKKLYLILLLFTSNVFAQQNIPDKYWITDDNFETSISGKDAFGDDNPVVIVEFWAKFNEKNCFADWDKIENAKYFRVDISEAPNAKKKYKVRMAPTLIIFKEGIKQNIFKAGLDLVLKESTAEIQLAVDEANTASRF
tara:strand:+ start:215 stop:628 length:414 start_codon:yes stop_codon:yes gene_type:complete